LDLFIGTTTVEYFYSIVLRRQETVLDSAHFTDRHASDMSFLDATADSRWRMGLIGRNINDEF
jgi:hypothetical protein